MDAQTGAPVDEPRPVQPSGAKPAEGIQAKCLVTGLGRSCRVIFSESQESGRKPQRRSRFTVSQLVMMELGLTALLLAAGLFTPIGQDTAVAAWGGNLVAFIGAVFDRRRSDTGRG